MFCIKVCSFNPRIAFYNSTILLSVALLSLLVRHMPVVTPYAHPSAAVPHSLTPCKCLRGFLDTSTIVPIRIAQNAATATHLVRERDGRGAEIQSLTDQDPAGNCQTFPDRPCA